MLIETKLQFPAPSPNVVPRTDLLQQLDGVAERRLAIVVAPAGCGKSTLLAEWAAGLQGRGLAVGWFSAGRAAAAPRAGGHCPKVWVKLRGLTRTGRDRVKPACKSAAKVLQGGCHARTSGCRDPDGVQLEP